MGGRRLEALQPSEGGPILAVIIRTNGILTGTAFPEPGLTSLWWAPQTAGGSTADATDCLARFRAAWNAIIAHLDDAIAIDFDPICIAVEDTTGVLTGAFPGTDPATVGGTGAGDCLPRQTQGLLQLGTSSVIGGRRVRGRLFIPGPLEADNGPNGAPVAGYISDVTAAFAALNTAGATTSMPRVWHRPVNGAGGQAVAITSYACSTKWAALRSRR